MFAATLGVSIRYLFSDIVLQLFSLMKAEEYSYIMTALSVSIILLALGLSLARPASYIGLSNLFTASVFALTSMILYVLSKTLLSYTLMFGASSMVLFIWSFFILFYPREELKKLLLPLLSLSMLIPIPREIIDSLSVHLTRIVAVASSILSGAEIVSNPNGRIYLVADGAVGRISFEIITACSGIISVTSFLALVPLFIYFTRNRTLPHRFKAILVSSVLGLLIVFFGNILRVTAMILIAKSYDVSVAYAFFHSTPSYIYSILAGIVSVYVLFRLAGPRETGIGSSATSFRLNNTGSYTVLAVFLLFSLAFITTAIYVQEMTSVPLNLFESSHYSYDYVLEHTLNTILNDDVEVVYEKPVPALERVLGSSLVKSISLRYNNTFYNGYVEFAETPARFHGWWVCLTFQGYSVHRVWSEEAGSLTVTFIEYSRRNMTYLLGYAIFEVPLYFSNQTVDTGYIRLSLFIPVKKDIADSVSNFKSMILGMIRENLLQQSERKQVLLETLSTTDMFLVIATAGYYMLMFLSHIIYSIINGLKNRFRGGRG